MGRLSILDNDYVGPLCSRTFFHEGNASFDLNEGKWRSLVGEEESSLLGVSIILEVMHVEAFELCQQLYEK